MSNLQDYVNNLFTSFSQNRQQAVEDSWTDARNAFNRIIDTTKHTKSGEGENWRSSAYLGSTRQKIVAATAIIVDTMLQGGRINYLLQPSEMSREALEMAGFPEDYHEDNREKMEAIIDDQLSWAQADLQYRKSILCSAIYGGTFAKIESDEHTMTSFRPIAETINPDVQEALRYEFQRNDVTYPKMRHLSIWDCFTDLENLNPRSNLGFFHREFTRKAEVKKMLSRNDYGLLEDKLKAALKASDEVAPDSTATTNPKLDDLNTTFHNLRVLDFYGRVPTVKLRGFLENHAPDLIPEFDIDEDLEDDSCEETEVHMFLVGTNNTIVKITPVDDVLGRPVFYVPWEDNVEDSLKDVGVGDNCMNTQHLQNSIFRAIVDNQALSGNALLGVKEEHLMEKFDEVVPGKKIRISPDCQDIRQALQNFQIQDVSSGLIQVFNLVSQMLEDDSNIPRIQQGGEARREETAYSISQRLEKSGKYFGQIVRNFDDYYTEPIIRYMYYYNMIDPEVQAGKGDYDIQALGFSSFQDRVVRLAGLREFFEIALAHPEVFERLKLENLFREFSRMLDLDPDQVTYSEEEVAEKEAREAEEAQRQAELEALDMQQKQAAIARDNSQATINTVHANKANEELKLKQREAVQEALNNNNE